jgi:hypothetical protein
MLERLATSQERLEGEHRLETRYHLAAYDNPQENDGSVLPNLDL